MVRKMTKNETTKAHLDGNTIDEAECNGHSVPPSKTKLEEELARAYGEFQAAMQQVFGNSVSWQRTLTAAVVGIAAAAGVGVWIMSIASAATMLTTSTFIAFIIVTLGLVVAVIVGGVTGELLARGIMTRKIEDTAIRSYYATRSFVTSFFNKENAHA